MNLLRDLEGILFISGEKIEIKELSRFFQINEEEVKNALLELQEVKKDSGTNIKIINNTVIMVSNSECGEVINKYFYPEKRPKKLTKAALETLAIIAYNQPVTKSYVEKIRGVNVEKVIASLEERELIIVSGRKETIGNPKLYSVTDEFLAYMGIDKVEDLPKYYEVERGED